MTDSRPFQVAILAGGQGTRLRARTGELPKPLVPVTNKPLLQHQLELCRTHGFTDILLLLHYRPDAVIQRFGDGSAMGLFLGYEIEATPRGTAGALRDALPRLADRFLVLYGDTYLDVDLRAFWQAHCDSDADVTLFLHPNDHPQDSDLVVLDPQRWVKQVLPYPHPKDIVARNVVNAALYVMQREGLDQYIPANAPTDIAKQLFPAMLRAGRRLRGHVSPEYIKDIGTPERLDKVEDDIDTGVVERRSGRSLRTAVFLDRDGTLNREVEHLSDPAQVELLPGVAAALRRLNRSGHLAIVVTNQPVLARGEVTADGLEHIHARLDALLGEGNAYLDGLYVCPHHPHAGYAGEVPALKVRCSCRKPEPGLIEQACHELKIDRRASWIVGDTSADMEAGRRSGVRTILLRTGHAGRDDKHPLRPDYVMPDLLAAVDWILRGHIRMRRRLAPLAVSGAGQCRLVLVGGLARAGKSSAAQVLKELLAELGVTAHVISLDAWLSPAAARAEGAGVLSRYDMPTAVASLRAMIDAKHRIEWWSPIYDRKGRSMHRQLLRHSIGPADVLIVEGVPVLLDSALREASQLRVYVQVAEEERLDRLRSDYAWRDDDPSNIERLLKSRDEDETPLVAGSRDHAHVTVSSGELA